MIVQARMWSAAVVVPEKVAELHATNRRRRIRDDVGPFAEQRLDKTLGLAVGARRVGPGAQMPEPEGRSDAIVCARIH